MHSIFMLCFTYDLIFFGLTKFANNYEVFGPITSLAGYLFGAYVSLGTMIGSVIAYLFDGLFWGVLIEILQGQFFKVAFSKSDVISTVTGVPLAFLLYIIFPQNVFVFVICLAGFVSAIGYAIYYLRRYLNRKK